LAVAGRLLVDLDARRLETCPVYDHRPLYPPSLNRPWVRSWANRGTLGGKLRNNVWRQSGSRPLPGMIRGVPAIRFQGADCMVSDFACEAVGAIEAWVFVDPVDPGGTVLEIGATRVPASVVPPGAWHHLAVSKDGQASSVFLDGQKAAGQILPADCRRLHLGAHWDGWQWTDAFRGAIAQVRVHAGALTEVEIRRNYAESDFGRAVPPGPGLVGAHGKVIELDAAELPEGRLARWGNRGAAGGEFITGKLGLTLAPAVRVAEGRKGVQFLGGQYLRSGFAVPAELARGGAFTVAIRAYDPRQWQPGIGVLLSIGARPKPSLEFGLDQGDRKGAFRCPGVGECGFERATPYARTWQDIVWTYAGRERKTFRIYVDGRLSAEKEFELAAAADAKLALGSATAPGEQVDSFRGLIASVRVFGYALGEPEVAFLTAGRGTKPDDARLLVHLDAGNLPEGTLAQWANAGMLGGQFGLDPELERRPVVAEVAGRRAVSFDGSVTFMQSSIPTPPGLTGSGPFTIEAWVHSRTLRPVETVFGLAPEAAKKTFMDWLGNGAVECNIGCGLYNDPSAFANGTDGFNIAWEGAPPKLNAWHHLAWVYSGGPHGSVAVYVDGTLNAVEEHVSLNTYPGFPMHLGAAWNTARGPRRMSSGALHRLTVYDYARTAAEIRAAAAQ